MVVTLSFEFEQRLEFCVRTYLIATRVVRTVVGKRSNFLAKAYSLHSGLWYIVFLRIDSASDATFIVRRLPDSYALVAHTL